MKKSFAAMCLTLLLAVVLLVIPNATAYAANDNVDIANSVQALGVEAYEINTNEDEIAIKFTHKDKNKSGNLYSKLDNHKDKYVLRLERNKDFLTVDWDAYKGQLMLKNNNNEPIIFTFNNIDRKWECNQENGFEVLNENLDDLKLMVSIFNDVSYLPTTDLEEEEATIQSLCPDYSNQIQGGPEYDTYRSRACEEAHADAASKCSNEYCYGCYSYVGPCDCTCLLADDMWCHCIIFGYPCTEC